MKTWVIPDCLTANGRGVFGLASWRGFLAASPMARAALEQNLIGYEKLQSVFAAVRLLHGGVGLAYAVQGLAAVIVCGALIWGQRWAFRHEAEGPAMVAAALLASPFLLDYDLMLLAIPLAWLTAQGLRTGFLPWEKLLLAAEPISMTAADGVALAGWFIRGRSHAPAPTSSKETIPVPAGN